MPVVDEIWVVAFHRHGELHDVTVEVLHEAGEVAQQLGLAVAALVLGRGEPPWLGALAGHGADRVYVVDHTELEPYAAETHLPVLEHLIREHRPLSVWLGATADGRDLAPRLALRLGTVLAAGCVAARGGAGRHLLCTCPVVGGKLHATLDLPLDGRPCVVTFAPGFRGTEPTCVGTGGETPGTSGRHVATVRADVMRLRVPANLPATVRRVRHREFLPADHRTVDIREADRILGAGRGVGGPEGVRLVTELAGLVGAAVGGTRVAVDRGWLPFDRQIGTTGRVVSPRLYIAFGVSGAVQHIAGLKDVQHLIAVNNDRTAPIFAFADLGLVGDAPGVLRALIEQLQVREAVAAGVAAGGSG